MSIRADHFEEFLKAYEDGFLAGHAGADPREGAALRDDAERYVAWNAGHARGTQVYRYIAMIKGSQR